MINWSCCLWLVLVPGQVMLATPDLPLQTRAGDLDSYPVDPELCGNFFIGSDINFLN